MTNLFNKSVEFLLLMVRFRGLAAAERLFEFVLHETRVAKFRTHCAGFKLLWQSFSTVRKTS